MKKIIIFSLLSGLFLVGCGSNSEKKETSDSKVDQLETRVKDLESSSSSEAKESKQDKTSVTSSLSSDINKKIAEAFLNNDLKMYNSSENFFDQENWTNDSPIPESELVFVVKDKSEEVKDYINIVNYQNDDQISESKIFYESNLTYKVNVSENKNIKSLLYASTEMDQDVFNKYKKVFENIK
ncbi:hypothetical protein [Candidatus Enterococcus mansonii]|uniref:Lipoprotein n=1 Tax=Candidatus Enterococcus mansonii TaxID=1834181 RepID=A0A242CH76_9ENTE|nr:hypothetical protein [Enterococcus sp. 4G2_DIV0659]OTO09585.1 hypothetical protein A5880_000264 [Enterococcus sp. 4G2_DIV0659]